MKKLFKRTLAILLAVIMIGGAAPVVGLVNWLNMTAAAEGGSSDPEGNSFEEAYSLPFKENSYKTLYHGTFPDGDSVDYFKLTTSDFDCDVCFYLNYTTRIVTNLMYANGATREQAEIFIYDSDFQQIGYAYKGCSYTYTVHHSSPVPGGVSWDEYVNHVDNNIAKITVSLEKNKTYYVRANKTVWVSGFESTTIEYDLDVQTVNMLSLSGISVNTMPTKTTYTVGESFDQSGLTLTAKYSDNSTQTISGGFTCSGFSSTTAGTKTITVTYEGKTTTFTVTVNPAPVTLSSISVKTMPTKTSYNIGESFDQSGLTLTAKYSDNSTQTISGGFTCSGFSSTTAGTKTITVTYEGKTTTFTVTVNPAPVTLSSIFVKTMPTKTTYTVGESFNQSGLTLTAKYSDNSTQTISSGFTCSGFSSTTAGTKTVTVTYEGKTTTFTVTVNPAPVTLSSISVKTLPTKTTYNIGESFNQSGLTLTAKYSDNSTQTITSGFTCSGFSSATAGTKTVTVTYEGKTTTFNVTVNPAPVTLSSIFVKTMPTKTTYTVGESFNQSGLTLTAKYSDNSTQTISSGFTCSGFSSTTAGTKTVTVTYEGKTTTFTVTVNPAPVTLSSISVKTMPTKTTYNIGESFNQSGLTLTAKYSDNSTQTISSGFTCSGFSSTTAGTKTITVTYEGKTTTFTVTVNPAPVTLSSISVKTMPTKTTYNIGESFNQSGLTLTAKYSDNSTQTISSGFTCSGFSSTTAGTKTITVTYEGKTTTFTVTVIKAEQKDVTLKLLTPSRNKIKFMDTIVLHAQVENLPEGAKVVWTIADPTIVSIDSEGDPCTVSGHGKGCHTCKISGTNKGTTTITCTVCDADGNPIKVNGKVVSASVEMKVRFNIFMVIFSFIYYAWFVKHYEI